MDQRAKEDFLAVLKLCKDEIFADAYYDINYWRNVNLKKQFKSSPRQWCQQFDGQMQKDNVFH